VKVKIGRKKQGGERRNEKRKKRKGTSNRKNIR